MRNSGSKWGIKVEEMMEDQAMDAAYGDHDY